MIKKHKHCWHNNGYAEYIRNELVIEKTCCHCGKKRKFKFHEGDNVIVHGEYLIENKMLKVNNGSH